eukprot:COSAG06_NODE_1941_length_8015_cov_2.703007_2_plen_55_part_00
MLTTLSTSSSGVRGCCGAAYPRRDALPGRDPDDGEGETKTPPTICYPFANGTFR